MDINDNVTASPYAGAEGEPAKKGKKRLFFLLGGVALVAVIVLALVLLPGGGTGSAAVNGNCIFARIGEDGTAYLPLMNGKTLTVRGEIRRAAITADRKHVIVLDEDGNLYVTDKNQRKKTKVSDEADSFFAVRDGGFFFTEGDLCCRYGFKGAGTVELGEVSDYTVARDSLSILFSTKNGKIYTLPFDAEEPERVGSADGSLDLCGVSDDGSISVWSVADGGEITIFLNEGEERTTLGRISSSYDYTYATFSEDQQLLVVGNSYGEQIWLKKPGEEPVRVKLGAEPDGTAVFSEQGYLSLNKGEKLSAIYYSAKAGKGINVYYITMEGERERVLSGVYSYFIANGRIFYLDTDNDLCCAVLKGDELKDEEVIAEDVDLFEVSRNGQYVYFIKDYDDSEEAGDLYCYKLGAKGPVKVSGGAACICYRDYGYYGYLLADLSTDGGSIFFFKDRDSISGAGYEEQGTLMSWSYRSGDRAKIAGDVILYTLNSGNRTGELNAKGFVFMKNGSADRSGTVTGDWYYYNGKEAVKIAAEVTK